MLAVAAPSSRQCRPYGSVRLIDVGAGLKLSHRADAKLSQG